jgi:Tfp pilus assembly protein PilF
MRVLDVWRNQRLLVPVAMILLGGILAIAAGCSSSKPDERWKAQKAYGARMAQKGFWREALFRFQHAAAERPDDPQIQNDLAVAYESVGETARALAAYKRALELAPEDPKIKRNYARFAEYYTSVQRAAAAPAPSAPTPSPSPTPAPPSEPITAAPAPTPVVPPPPLPTPVIAPGPPK